MKPRGLYEALLTKALAEDRFDRRFRALLGGSRRDLQRQIDRGFPFLPAGCHMELDHVARDIVLANIREALPSRWSRKVEELRAIARTQDDVTLGTFIREAELDLDDVYHGSKSWSDLRAAAGLSVEPDGPNERALRRACGRVLHIDDRVRLEAYRRFLRSPEPPIVERLSERERRLLRMLVSPITDAILSSADTLENACSQLWSHFQVRTELLELVDVLDTRVDHLQHDLTSHPDVPLRVHARYSRIEILAAFGVGSKAKVSSWQSGVYWAEDARADLFAFTLDKTSGHFTPKTRYRDYAISRSLIHWQSQSVTREDSETGRRYQNHQRMGSAVMLFGRLRTDDRAFWFLGPATYVNHQSETPMSVTWQLNYPLPGDLFEQFAAAVA